MAKCPLSSPFASCLSWGKLTLKITQTRNGIEDSNHLIIVLSSNEPTSYY